MRAPSSEKPEGSAKRLFGLAIGPRLLFARVSSMGERVDSHGEIETMLHGDQAHGPLVVGDKVLLVFRAIDDPEPPIGVIIHSPNGQRIVDRVIRELPTGLPQSAPPVEFIPAIKGTYKIEVKELKGKQRGNATLRIG